MLQGFVLVVGWVVVVVNLAADVSSHPETEQDSPSFVLSAESGINNGLAVALVMLVLGMMGLSDSGSGALGSLSLLGAWTVAGGLLGANTIAFSIGARSVPSMTRAPVNALTAPDVCARRIDTVDASTRDAARAAAERVRVRSSFMGNNIVQCDGCRHFL